VRVNAVAPGPTNTGMGTHEPANSMSLPMGRYATGDEVAAAVVFLLSDASAAFTGQTLNPNSGGYMP
jgi:3-oxoacyl-[acyl-carrier protein] reductase